MKKTLLTSAVFCAALQLFGQARPKPQDTEFYTPVPAVVTPGKSTTYDAPSDVIVLFDGKNLDQWSNVKDPTKPAEWTVKGNEFIVKKGTGDIQTKQSFTDYQLHIEFKIPKGITGKSQARGNSGIFLASPGNPGGGGYELQVLDSYENQTYTNGQAGSIYKQHPPLANPNRPPGDWQTYDVAWTAPRFNQDSTLKTPAKVTAFLNGILVQNNFELIGETMYIGTPFYKSHGASPIKLQDHGDPSQPISYKNIWIRPSPAY